MSLIHISLSRWLTLIVLLFSTYGHSQEELIPLKIIHNSARNCYTAENEFGVTVIPCYSGIGDLGQNLYFVSRKEDGRDKFGVYDHAGNKVIPVKYDFVNFNKNNGDELIYYGYSGERGVSDTKYAAMHITKRKHLPLGNKIKAWPERREYNEEYRFYIVRTDDSTLLFDKNLEPVLQTEQELVSPYLIYKSPDSDGTLYYHYGTQSPQKIGVLNANNEIITPAKYKRPYFHRFKIKGKSAIIAEHQNGHDLYYDMHPDSVINYKYMSLRLQSKEGLIVKTKNNEWQYLDSNLNILWRSKKYGLDHINYPFDLSKHDEWQFIHETTTYGGDFMVGMLDLRQSVLFSIDFGKFDDTQYEGRHNMRRAPKFGLVNYETGKTVPVDYDYAIPIKPYDKLKEYSGNPTAFWMVKAPEQSDQIILDVYDLDFNLTKSLALHDSSLHFLRRSYINGDTTCRVLMNEAGKFGFVSANGTIRGQFKFTSHIHGWHYYYMNTYLLGIDNSYGVYDKSGNSLLPMIYETIVPYRETHAKFVLGKYGEVFDCIDPDGKILIDGISELWSSRSLKRNFEYKYLMHLAIKDGFAYAMDGGGQFRLMTDEWVRFISDTLSLEYKDLVIDRTGKVVE